MMTCKKNSHNFMTLLSARSSCVYAAFACEIKAEYCTTKL